MSMCLLHTTQTTHLLHRRGDSKAVTFSLTILSELTMTHVDKHFTLQKPCSNCPFRDDGQAVALNPGRREEIIERLLRGVDSNFPCHKTVYRSDGRNHDANGNYSPTDIKYCPGAIAVCRKLGRDTVAVQCAVRLGVIRDDHYAAAMKLTLDPDQLNIDRSRSRI